MYPVESPLIQDLKTCFIFTVSCITPELQLCWVKQQFVQFSLIFQLHFWLPWGKCQKKSPKLFLIKKLFLVLLIIRSKLSLSKKLADSMILPNDLCQPSVHSKFNFNFRIIDTFYKKLWWLVPYYHSWVVDDKWSR